MRRLLSDLWGRVARPSAAGEDTSLVLTRLQEREHCQGRAIDRAERKANGMSLCENSTRERSKVPEHVLRRVRVRMGLEPEVKL